MLELVPQDFRLVRPLFASLAHHRAIVYSVLEGACPGRVFVDDLTSPETAFVASITEFFVFAGSPNNAAFMSEIKEALFSDVAKNMGAIVISGADGAWKQAIDGLLNGLPGAWVRRNEYDFSPGPYAACKQRLPVLPAGLSLQVYDHQIAAGAGELELFWNGIDNFVRHGIGYAVMEGEKPVCRCHSVVVGDGQAEISVETAEPYRRLGLARVALSAFIDHCGRAGLNPHWTCWDNNLASNALASSLGFAPAAGTAVRYVERAG
jgi:GNAT superfamily N-acetyltransferase